MVDPMRNTPGRQSNNAPSASQSTISDPENIKVIVRLRPQLQLVQPLDSSTSPRLIPRPLRSNSPDELLPDCPYVLEPEQASIHAGGSWYTFDGVHAPSSSTSQIYEAHIASMIRDAVSGFNSTLFAYGATGSGKSHSMMGGAREHGIMFRAIEDVFDMIEQDEEREYVVRVSYLEIYNEQLRDLLSTDHHPHNSSSQQPLPKIHEDRQGRIFVRPLVSTPCAEPEEVMELLWSGESRRRTERTEWNARSSRSHAIFSLTLESRPVVASASFPITSSTMREATGSAASRQTQYNREESLQPSAGEVFLGTGAAKLPITPSIARFKSSVSSKTSSHTPDGSIRISQLNLVDLAGSEKLTDNEARNKEASYIKKSLLALQSVVTSLTELSNSTSQTQQKQRLLHVPYRNSQLTRLLQTSLSGNAKVAFLCTISPDPDCEVETLSTLRFASGAKKVVTKAELGQVVDRATLLEALESKVLELEAALLTNADYTEALERERDEAIERADGAAKICFDYEAKLAELQTLRTPLKEQHDHLRRLIITGSPHSSYATQNTLDQHGNPSTNTTPNAVIHRRKSAAGTARRGSRLATQEGAAPNSPGKKIGWKELFFEEGQTDARDDKKPKDEQQCLNTDQSAKINELNLTVAKLEATLAEAEDTYAGELNELKAEIANLEARLKHDKTDINHGDQLGTGDLDSTAEIALLRAQSQKQMDSLQRELDTEQKQRIEFEKKWTASEIEKARLLQELTQMKKYREEGLTKRRSDGDKRSKNLLGPVTGDRDDRRLSEVTLDGEIEDEEISLRNKSTNKFQTRVTEDDEKKENNRSTDSRSPQISSQPESEGLTNLDEQTSNTNRTSQPNRKRTGSQRNKKKHTESDVQIKETISTQPVRRSTRSNSSKNVLSSVENNES